MTMFAARVLAGWIFCAFAAGPSAAASAEKLAGSLLR
jgi:hypothetical protein